MRWGNPGEVPPETLAAALCPLLGDRTAAFVRAGVAALDGLAPSRSWAHVGVAPKRHLDPALYHDLAALLARLGERPDVENAFLMHKPPGIRIRVQTTPQQRDALAAELLDELAALPGVEHAEPGVYEPEELLFGGPDAMVFAHRLFTVDTLAWADFHALGGTTPNWAFSLALLRHTLNGLEISGWEDLEVWRRIQRQTYRRLPEGLDQTRITPVVEAIRLAWADPQRLRDALAPAAAAVVERHRPALLAAGAAWTAGYFTRPGTLIGPREAAAFVTIFHWNRGRLSAMTQALAAAALADRSARP
ncbi:thiopeptide-type bacteriocin biosynthesis protein [Catellatospora bangladeshensis]|uniref:Thiopeptide-type bacteriocin biosynthesis domain-containing protein n=1 Tax=Catellatospora bangladeshensis TaxID=310355 RepID=A0A8J3JC46_9ACTN|nr:thiopeptide-type bacteriocin biosynthesis protein [Catellatospora bangladeshensis]GIF81561.1 hypothetical protein Cba03nite_29100 [Catellatospora bangladeshensis]